ncbi:protein FAR1-RELATED SEQUENCE 5-like [Rhododendron vialii]|uniref:protein FAR1-RELATED SEQUENCE 5-like n=1 Tax=Rhododendron vialii TaxID=182163 RepID=UPI0026604135|nr:protein FAR1-RELATED SEQUENCE 5-like [Rhododendron vialii]
METPVEDKFIATESLVGAKLDLLDVGTNQEPNEGMSFESDEAARAFYDEYARRIGFLTRIVSSRKSERDGSVISRRLACNKEGYNRNNRKTGPCRIRKRESHREGCMAMVLLKREKLGEWVVTKFVREHNHPLEVSSEKWHPNPEPFNVAVIAGKKRLEPWLGCLVCLKGRHPTPFGILPKKRVSLIL